jgi:hypothetical protein
MCLNIENKTRPATEDYRWKFLDRTSNGLLISPLNDHMWKPTGEVNYASVNERGYYDQNGFHVYLTEKDAVEGAKQWVVRHECKDRVIVKLKVEDFRACGTIEHCDPYSNGKEGEIWGMATIVEIFPAKSYDDVVREEELKEYNKHLKL